MPPSCSNDCQSDISSSFYVKNEQIQKNKKYDMVPNRIIILFVFVSGIAVAFFGTLLQRYLYETKSEFSGK